MAIKINNNTVITDSRQFLGIGTDTATAPSYSWSGDADTGIFRPGADIIGLSTAGTEKFRIAANGNIGIATTTPEEKLHIFGASPWILISNSDETLGGIKFNDSDAPTGQNAEIAFDSSSAGTANNLRFSVNNTEHLRINTDGRIGIGNSGFTNTRAAIGSSISGSNPRGLISNDAIAGTVTGNYVGLGTFPNATAAAVVPTLIHFLANQNTFTAGANVTNQVGFEVASSLTGADTNIAFRSNIAAGTNRWGFFASGTANNSFNGNTGLGTGATAPAERLDVVGNIRLSGNIIDTGALSIIAGGTNQNITLTPSGTGTVNAPTFNATSVDSGGFQGIANDSVGTPSFTWTSDLDTGIYRISSGTVGITGDGNLRASFGGAMAYYKDSFILPIDDAAATSTTTTINSARLLWRSKHWTGTASANVDWNALVVPTNTAGDSEWRLRTGTTNRLVVNNSGNVTATTFSGSGASLTSLNASNISSGTLVAARGGTGLTSAGTAGNILTSTGTGWESRSPDDITGVGGDYKVNYYTSPGTWTKPAGLKAIKVTVIGGGGSALATSGGVGGGGGAGSAIRRLAFSVIPGPVSITVGAAAPTAPGAVGGTSSFGSFASATGGSTRPGISPLLGGGNAGSATGGDINMAGQRGRNAFPYTVTSLPAPQTAWGGGEGGSSGYIFSENYGHGGLGGAPAPAGRSGSPGIVIVEEFY